MTSLEFKDKIVSLLSDKKVEKTEEINVAEKSSITDWFVIVTVRNALQVRMIADFLEEKGKEEGFTAYHRDGENGSGWIVMDYGNVIVHIFTFDQKEKFSLDKLWGDKK